MLKYVECPRDSWQGLSRVMSTGEKVAYLQRLLDSGFRHLDMGSFVSPKAVPQLADTEEVLAGLQVPEAVDLLAIIANERGLERAVAAARLTSVGYPLSVNDTFQRRNTGRSLEAAWTLVEQLTQAAEQAGLGFVVYLSMGFGNPYGEPWAPTETAQAVARVRDLGVRHIALADTVGSATPARLGAVLEAAPTPEELGLHLHSRPDTWQGQLEVALDHGLRWFEGALAGVGGCPFAADALVGNLPTEEVLPWLERRLGHRVIPADTLAGIAREAARLAGEYA